MSTISRFYKWTARRADGNIYAQANRAAELADLLGVSASAVVTRFGKYAGVPLKTDTGELVTLERAHIKPTLIRYCRVSVDVVFRYLPPDSEEKYVVDTIERALRSYIGGEQQNA